MKRDLLVTLSMVATLSLSSERAFSLARDTMARSPTKAIEAVPGEYIVKLKESSMLQAAGVTSNMMFLGVSLGGRIKSRFAGDNSMFVVKKQLASAESTEAREAELVNNPLVEYVEPNYIYHLDKLPNDPDLGKSWGLRNIGQKDKDPEPFDPKDPDKIDRHPPQSGIPGMDIGAEKAWEVTTGSRDVVVAIIDSGIDLKHPELVDNLWTNEKEARGITGVDDDGNGYIDDIHGYNFAPPPELDPDEPRAPFDPSTPQDDDGHGTHCAGVIGATGNDGKGVVGVNWNVRLMAVKALGERGGTLAGLIKAIDYATQNGARIESNSWGGKQYSPLLKAAIERARKKQILFVAAAGNLPIMERDRANNDNWGHWPANYEVDNVLSVAAMDNRGGVAGFSGFGVGTVHVAAPGVNVYSTVLGGKHAVMSGTSMATPHVAGVAALVLAANPGLSATELKARIIGTVVRMENWRKKVSSGGRVNAEAAVLNRPSARDENNPANWPRRENYRLSSPHPYPLSKTLTFTVSKPGARKIAVHFAKFETESESDEVTIRDALGNKTEDALSGTRGGEWSSPVDGDTLTITLESDATNNLYGFDLDQIAYQ